jgi:hypothetical protein
MLQDAEYWAALNEVSGRYVSVFVFYSPMREPEPNDTWEHKHVEKASEAMEILRRHFSNKSLTLPSLLFFQVAENKVADSYAVKIKDDGKEEETFLEIKKILGIVRDAIKRVDYDNKDNAGEIFNMIRSELKDHKLKVTIGKGAKWVLDAEGLVGLLLKLVGVG